MKRFLALLLAPVLFFAGVLASLPGFNSQPGSHRRPPANHATLQFEHLFSFDFVTRFVGATLLLAITLTAVSAQYGSLAAIGLFIAMNLLCTPKVSQKLGLLAVEYDATEIFGVISNYPVAAATKLYAGGLWATDGNGRLVPASDTAGLKVVGRGETTADNSAGAAGDISANVKRGTFKYANSGTHAITQAMVGKKAYVEDDSTVASTSTNLIGAGRIVRVDSDGVFIDTARASNTLVDSSTGTAGATVAAGAGVHTISLPLVLSKIGAADVLTAYVPGYAFKILSLTVAVTSPVTTGAKLATLTPKITGVALTGGVLALTSANLTPLGALVAASAVTALNTGTAADSITITGSAVTAFVEGEAVLLIKVQNMDTANALASLSAANA